jgi:aspartyl-tRNA(Asn)/glutamyl-tRNA(Gln) amidotransferase subunit A
MADLPSTEELAVRPARALAADIAARRISPVELTESVIARVERLEPRLNGFAHFDAEGARAQARAAEARVMRGDTLPPLHGLTVSIKDLTDVAGMPTRRGSLTTEGHVAAEDSVTTARFREAGAVILGKTTTSEFGWSGISRCPATGISHNPWKQGMNAGASSAGAGVAAAAAYGPLHQGSDGAGSIRMPAHFCGVVGLKPTFGRVPYVPPGNNDYMSNIGPMARSVDDAAMMFASMAGVHPLDVTTLDSRVDVSPEALKGGVAGLRVAYSPDLGVAVVHPEVAALVERAARTFEAMGATVEQVTPPWAADGPALIKKIWAAHMTNNVVHLDRFGDRMDPGLVACIREGADMLVSEYLAVRARKYLYAIAVQDWFRDWDLLLTPSASVPAFPAELLMPADWPKQHAWDWATSWAEFSYPFNISQNPAASVPCGLTGEGLPVGLQIVGKRLDDAGVLRAAAAFEEAQPFARAPV